MNKIDFCNIKSGYIFDCKDEIGNWYPAIVISKYNKIITVHYKGWNSMFDEIIDLKKDSDRLSTYKSKTNYYGISPYTLEYVKSNIYYYTQNILEESNKDKKLEIGQSVYLELPNTSYDDGDDFIYIEAIVQTINVKCKSLGVSFNDNDDDIIEVNINSVLVTTPKKYKKYRKYIQNDKNADIFINSQRIILNDNNNIISTLTNSFISDYSRTTVFSNKNVDMYNNGILVT